MGFIDIHNHLAWEIDDGMPCRDDALKALKMAKEDGIEAIIATPHLLPPDTTEENFRCINSRIMELKELAEETGIDVYSGCEFLLNDASLEWFDKGIYNRLGNSDYLLCEFNPRVDISNAPYADDILYELTIRGVTPVVAHVERYYHNSLDLDQVQRWIDMGCYIQVNRTSLIADRAHYAKKNAEKLLQAGMCHIVATDAHRAEGRRICRISDGYEVIEQVAGKENARLLTQENPMRILNNDNLEHMHEVKRKGFFSRLRGKR